MDDILAYAERRTRAAIAAMPDGEWTAEESLEGDGVTDADEAGDADLSTAPVDTDGDDVPDYLDSDSDDDCLISDL